MSLTCRRHTNRNALATHPELAVRSLMAAPRRRKEAEEGEEAEMKDVQLLFGRDEDREDQGQVHQRDCRCQMLLRKKAGEVGTVKVKDAKVGPGILEA